MGVRDTRRVFVASPGDMVTERAIIREVAETINGELEAERGLRFEVVGWDIVRGTAARPQEAINELVTMCDYMVVIFGNEWGSSPGGPLEFTSGTEEELFVALQCLADPAERMKDVWIAFTQAAPSRWEVTAFRERIQSSKALYYEDTAGPDDLREKIAARLRGWAERGGNSSRSVDILPLSDRDVLRANRLRFEGELLVRLGESEPGIARLREAAAAGALPEILALARVLGRRGEYPEALRLCDGAIDVLIREPGPLRGPSLAEAIAYRADLSRRDGDARAAAIRLQQALEYLTSGDDYTVRVRCKILDNLGLAHKELGELPQASQRFLEALDLRQGLGDGAAIAQSRVNLGRLAVAQQDLATAMTHAEEAVEVLREFTPTDVLANAYLLLAQVKLRVGHPGEAVEFAERSLAINTQLANKFGEAMSLNVLAQSHNKLDDRERARECALRSIVLNEEMGRNAPPVLIALARTVDVQEEE